MQISEFNASVADLKEKAEAVIQSGSTDLETLVWREYLNACCQPGLIALLVENYLFYAAAYKTLDGQVQNAESPATQIVDTSEDNSPEVGENHE
jgi:hypothetical protein